MEFNDGDRLNWQVKHEAVERLGFRRILKRLYQLPDGREVQFDLKLEQQCVAILAITADHQVVLVRQFRPGPNRILLEMPGGGIEDGEGPQEAAARELLEETGYQGDLQFVTSSVDCAYSTTVRFNFVAVDCKKISEPTPDENEFVEVVTISVRQFRDLLRSGELSDVESGYLGLDFLGLL